MQETWEISLLKSKTWKWDQKNNGGGQVPDGSYFFAGEFNVGGRAHPVVGDGVEIVEKIVRNVITPRMLLYQILDKFPNAFPILRYLLRL